MEETQIIIVGNGFDVNHGIPSSYAHFKTWLSNNDKELFDFLERYIDVAGDWWNDFERSLSEIDVPKLIRDTLLENRPVDPRIPPSFSHSASWRLDSVRRAISQKFTEWVKTMETYSDRPLLRCITTCSIGHLGTNKVCVYGLSFSEVDYPYLQWIAERNRNLRWRVSWHTENDKQRIENTFRALRVREYEMFEM